MEDYTKDVIGKHKLRVKAYRHANRLLRRGDRKLSNDVMTGQSRSRTLFEGALLMPPPEQEEVDMEQVRKERLEKNKAWRKKKEIERWKSCGLKPPPSPEEIKERNRQKARKIEKKLYKELMCTNCGNELETDVWECAEGHVTCGDCFDKENIGKDIHETDDDNEHSDAITSLKSISRKTLKNRNSLSLDSLKKSSSNSSVATVCSIDTIISLRESLASIAEGDEDAEIKSFQKYLVNEIDFFLNTLEVRGDAIDFYKDYNNENKSIFYNPDLEGISLDGDNNEEQVNQSNAYVDEKSERVKNYIERLRDQGSLLSLRETLIGVIETIDNNDNNVDPAWAKFRLEEIDFFLNTLNIRKDAIGYYGDYHNGNMSIFDHLRQLEDNEDSDEDDIDEEDDDAESSSDNDEKITRCAVCNNFIVRRNGLVEKLAKIFFTNP